MRNQKVASRVGAGAPVYLAAVLEYLTARRGLRFAFRRFKRRPATALG